jgi:hypothetical protein
MPEDTCAPRTVALSEQAKAFGAKLANSPPLADSESVSRTGTTGIDTVRQRAVPL